jgi:hypothetical protein
MNNNKKGIDKKTKCITHLKIFSGTQSNHNEYPVE